MQGMLYILDPDNFLGGDFGIENSMALNNRGSASSAKTTRNGSSSRCGIVWRELGKSCEHRSW